MNRNVTIIVIILVLVVIFGYLIWLRSRIQSPLSQPQIPEVSIATPLPEQSATPSASPAGKEATGSMKQKTATSGATGR